MRKRSKYLRRLKKRGSRWDLSLTHSLNLTLSAVSPGSDKAPRTTRKIIGNVSKYPTIKEIISSKSSSLSSFREYKELPQVQDIERSLSIDKLRKSDTSF